jgi:phage host-nuclease inhibitor protein Gam
LTSEKILEVENLLQALSEELLKLKSASEHYEETKENLQKMCESIDKISLTHQKLTDNIRQVLAEMEKTNLENKKTREFIQSLYDEAKHLFEAEAHRHEADNANQSKALRLTTSLIVVGIVMEAVVIIRMFLF